MGNRSGKSSVRRKSTSLKTTKKKNAKTSHVGLPVMRPNGVSYRATSETLAKRRKGRENKADEDLKLSYNYVDELVDKKESKVFADLTILGNVNCTKGSKEGLKDCQDQAIAFETEVNGVKNKILAVFDGHGDSEGLHVSTACTVLLEDLVTGVESICTKSGEPLEILLGEGGVVPMKPKNDLLNSDPKKFLEQTFEFIHKSVITGSDFSARNAGTTATVAVIQDRKLTIAWAGDSRAALFVTASDEYKDFFACDACSTDNLQTREERARIKKAGGRVGHPGNIFHRINPESSAPVRVFGNRGDHKPGLMLSKSIGDEYAHTLGLTYVPKVKTYDFGDNLTVAQLKLLTDEFSMSNASFGVPTKASVNQKVRTKTSSFNSTMSKMKQLTKKISRRTMSSGGGSTPKKRLSQGKLMDLSNGELVPGFTKPIKHCVLVVASDGLWDHMSKDTIAEHLPKLLKAKQKGETRNISFELGLLAIEQFRSEFETPTIDAKNDDISIVTSILF